MLKKSHLIGKENRLIYRLNEDVKSQVRYTSRVADANASRQEMQRAQNQLATSSNVQSIDPATKQLVTRSISGPLTTTTAGGQQATQDMQARAAGVDYNAVQGGTRTGPSSADIMDQATISAQGLRTNFNQTTGNIRSDNTRVNTGQIGEAARERLMDNGMTPTQAALSVQGNRGDVQQAFNQVGTNSASDATGSVSDIESQVRQQYENMGISDPAIINNGIASAIQADNARNQAADMASQRESTRASNSAASNAAANEMQQSPQTQRALGSLEIGLAGLPPEDAAAIRAGLQATMGAQDQERNAAGANYSDTMDQIDSSEKKSGALLDGMGKEAEAFYDAASKFADENAKRREESAAKQREDSINRLKWEEDKGRREMKSANDRKVNSLVLSQAIGGGFGSSNWIAEVADAEWAGEQALVDLSKEFGFKRADVDIAYTNTLDGIYETAGTKKLEALKEYKADRQNISQLRFASSEKNDERRLEAKQKLNDTLSTIGKEEAKEIKSAGDEVRATLKELRVEKRQEEQQKKSTAYNMFTWAFSNSTDPALRGAAVKMMNEAGYNLPNDLDLNALTIDDQLRLMETTKETEASLLYDPSQYTDKESHMIYQQAINAVTGIPGATDPIRESNLRQVKALLDAGDIEGATEKVRSIASLKLKGEAPDFAARSAIISEAEQLISVLENNPEIRNMYTGKWNDAMSYLATNQNEDYLAVTSWLGNLTAETIKERYGSAISDGERKEMQRSIPSGKETVQDAITKLKAMVRSNRVKNDAMLDINMGSVSKSTPPPSQSQDFGTDWVIQQMKEQQPPTNGGGGTVTIPKENNSIQTGFVNGIVTGYGSKYWEAGVDIAAPKGSPIKSPLGGVVEDVVYNPAWVGTPNNPKVGKSQNGGWGNTVKIRYPDGVKLQFAHLSKTAIGKDMVGKTVDPGATLAYVGNTGNTYGKTGVHVDVTGYRPDGSTMTAEEVTEWMLRNSSTHS